MLPQKETSPASGAGGLWPIIRVCDALTGVVSVLGGLALLALTSGIVLGIVLRQLGIDNSWTYDFDIYGLVWTGFVGAVLTARQDRHVTAGIALELYAPPRLRMVLKLLRVILVLAFLVVLTYSGWLQAMSSYSVNEQTLDVAQWPVWVAKIALPIGTAFWAVAEIAKFLRLVAAGQDVDTAAEPEGLT